MSRALDKLRFMAKEWQKINDATIHLVADMVLECLDDHEREGTDGKAGEARKADAV